MTLRARLTPAHVAVSATLLLALAGGLSACGGDDEAADSSSGASSAAPEEEAAPTDEEFVAEANGVCADAYTDINAIAATVDPSDPAAVDQIESEFLPAVQDLQDRLNEVTPSEDLADGFEEAMATQQEQLDTVNADPASIFELDSSPTDAQFDAIGLTACGSASAE